MPVFSTSARMSASACAYAAPLPRMISGRFALLSRSSARLHSVRRRDLARRRIDDLDQRLLPGFRVDRLREQLGRQVEIDAAGAAGQRGADRARDAHADVLGMQHAERGLGERLGDGELVHLLVVALLQVDDLALARAADEDHREAVGGGVRERGQAVEEAGRRHRQADARLLRQEAGDRRGVARRSARDGTRSRACPQPASLRVRSVIGMPGRPKIVSMPLSLRASMTS